MARIVSKARQLRLDYAAKVGRVVEQKEVADAIEVTEATLSRVERGKLSRIDFDTLIKLCAYYTQALGRPVQVGDILEYDPNNKKASDQVLALQP